MNSRRVIQQGWWPQSLSFNDSSYRAICSSAESSDGALVPSVSAPGDFFGIGTFGGEGGVDFSSGLTVKV
jgi:hypothetical protein